MLLRIGPIDDRVQAISGHLQAEPVPVSPHRDALDPVLDAVAAQRLVLSADVFGLNALLLRLVRREQAAVVPIGWVADPDSNSRELSAELGLPSTPTLAADVAARGRVRAIPMVRDDHGGVLLHRGELTGWDGAASFGAQSYHDEVKVADGQLCRIVVRPDRSAANGILVDAVCPRRMGGRRARRSTGRAVQTACDEALATVDGVPHPRPVTRWTWYADPRQHWLLRG